MAASRIMAIPLLMAAALTVGSIHSCTTAPREVDAADRNLQLSEGYALLYDLLNQNRQVDRAMIIPFRSVSDEAASLLREIAAVSGDAADQIAGFAEVGPDLAISDTGLPAIERATRESVGNQTRQQLLAGDRERFELYLLLSQVEATRYASHLAGTLAEQDNHLPRRHLLEQVQARFDELYGRAVELVEQR